MSCLFRSLSHHVYNLGTEELRHLICNYLESDPIVMGEKFSSWLEILKETPSSASFSKLLLPNWKHRMILKEYTDNMRKPSTWGGGIEINCFCELFETRVIIHLLHSNNSKPIEFIPSNNQYQHTIHISYNGNHYEPMHIE
jgi:hypothetical protein